MSAIDAVILKILAIDLSHLFRVRWEASQGATDGEALRRTIASVMSIREGYDRVAVCCDAGMSFRRILDPARDGPDGKRLGYKANRQGMPASYYEQLRAAEERLGRDGCVVFQAPRVEVPNSNAEVYAEGDDVIASLARWCAEREHLLTIFTDDKDALQLVDDEKGIRVIRPGVDPPKLAGQAQPDEAWTADHVISKYEIPPVRFADVQAICGDTGDNYKPYHGIGFKTARDLIKEFGDTVKFAAALEAEPARVESIVKPAMMKILAAGGPRPAMLGLDLATLRRDLPIDFSPLLAEPRVAPVSDVDAPMGAGDAWEPTDDGDRRASPPPPPPSAPRAVEAEPVANDAKPEPEKSAAMVVASSTAIASVLRTEGSQIARYAFQPRNLEELWRLSKAFFDSRLYPQYPTREAIMVIAIEAAERGIPIGLALRNGYVVKGKPAWSAAFLGALVLASGKADIFEIVDSQMESATLLYKRVHRPEGRFVYTLDEAKRAGWLKSGERGDSKWITNPRTMCRWAAIRECARAWFPDVVAGMPTPDELRDGHVTDEEWEREERAA